MGAFIIYGKYMYIALGSRQLRNMLCNLQKQLI